MKPARVVAVFVCFALGGCGKAPPAELRVAAGDGEAFAHWQMYARRELPAELWRQLDAAMTEVRYDCVAAVPDSTPDALQEALCSRLDGKTVSEVIVLGDRAKLARLQRVRAELADHIRMNGYLITKPGDDVHAAQLAQYRVNERAQMEKLNAEIETVVAGMRARGDARALVSSLPNPSAPLSRGEGLAELGDLLDRRRTAAVLTYGAWPLRIDRTGTTLGETDRAEFRRLQAAAETGTMVIPVKLKGRWWFFDGASSAPPLNDFIAGRLTPEDRQRFMESWVDLEAEIWARTKAANAEPIAESVDAFRPDNAAGYGLPPLPKPKR